MIADGDSRARAWSVLLIAATFATSWLGMQVVHEVGHVVAAWSTDGEIVRVVLHPFALSRTDVAPNPHPLFVVWSGPLVGCGLPLLIYASSQLLRTPTTYLWRFFAGFCCVANGGYLGAGVVYPVGDAALLRELGVPAWILAVFGVVALAGGFALWNGLGPYFGIGPRRREVPARHALGTTGVGLLILVTELCFAEAR